MLENMNRRKYLTTVAGIGAVSLAGCSALSDDNTDELERRLREKNQTIDDLEQEVSDLEEDKTEFEQEVSDLEEDKTEFEQEVSDLEQNVSEVEEQRETLIVERMTTLYESAEEFWNLAEGAYSEGVTAIEQDTTEQDTSALNQFRAAWGQYGTVTRIAFEIVQLADNEGYSNAMDLATDANLYASNMREASESYALAAQNYLLDNSEAASQNISTGDTAFDEAQQYTFVSSTVFESSISS